MFCRPVALGQGQWSRSAQNAHLNVDFSVTLLGYSLAVSWALEAT